MVQSEKCVLALEDVKYGTSGHRGRRNHAELGGFMLDNGAIISRLVKQPLRVVSSREAV